MPNRKPPVVLKGKHFLEHPKINPHLRKLIGEGQTYRKIAAHILHVADEASLDHSYTQRNVDKLALHIGRYAQKNALRSKRAVKVIGGAKSDKFTQKQRSAIHATIASHEKHGKPIDTEKIATRLGVTESRVRRYLERHMFELPARSRRLTIKEVIRELRQQGHVTELDIERIAEEMDTEKTLVGQIARVEGLHYDQHLSLADQVRQRLSGKNVYNKPRVDVASIANALRENGGKVAYSRAREIVDHALKQRHAIRKEQSSRVRRFQPVGATIDERIDSILNKVFPKARRIPAEVARVVASKSVQGLTQIPAGFGQKYVWERLRERTRSRLLSEEK